MTERFANIAVCYIDYRLNQLGVRAWPEACQLISKIGGRWVTMGPMVSLPLFVPETLEELMDAWADPIRVTAYQYAKECPQSDIADILLKKKPFRKALRECGQYALAL